MRVNVNVRTWSDTDRTNSTFISMTHFRIDYKSALRIIEEARQYADWYVMITLSKMTPHCPSIQGKPTEEEFKDWWVKATIFIDEYREENIRFNERYGLPSSDTDDFDDE